MKTKIKTKKESKMVSNKRKCGTEQVLAFTKKGTRVLICPNIQARTSTFGIGKIQQIELWCDMEQTQKQVQPVRQLTKQQEKAVEAATKNDGLRSSFNKLVGKHMITELRQAIFEAIDDNKLLEQANLAIMLELPVFQILKLFNASFKLSRALGMKPEKGIEAIARGIRRKSRKILDNIGIVFNASDAYDYYKDMYNLESLTNAQKSEARKQYAIEQVIEKAQNIGKPNDKELERKRAITQQANGEMKLAEKLRK